MTPETIHHDEDNPLTVAELRERLADLDGSYVVRAYEGPGCWIIVEDGVAKPGDEHNPKVILQFTTHCG